jgi:hypothetical protein
MLREKRRKSGACIDPHGYDAGKKRQRRRCAEIKGKKRHILVDTLGLLLHAIVHPADRAFLQALFVRFKRPASLWLRVMTAD